MLHTYAHRRAQTHTDTHRHRHTHTHTHAHAYTESGNLLPVHTHSLKVVGSAVRVCNDSLGWNKILGVGIIA